MNTIANVLEFIRDRVIAFSDAPNSVLIENVALLGETELGADNFSKIFMTVLKIDEERLASDPNVFFRKEVDEEYSKRSNPVKYFTLNLLFAACSSNQRYAEALQRLEKVLECFQEQHIYEIPLPDGLESLRILLELRNMDLNEQNQLWSILGGKYFPSVVYRVKMIPILSISEEGFGVVERIRIDVLDKPNENGLTIETTNDLTKN